MAYGNYRANEAGEAGEVRADDMKLGSGRARST